MLPAHTAAFPEMFEGMGGTEVDTFTDKVALELLPQVLFAVTVILPLEVPAFEESVVVGDVPVQPAGSVHV